MRKLRLLAYYLVARHLPDSTMPGGRLWRSARRWIAGPLFERLGEDVNIEHGAYFGSGSGVRLGSRSGLGVNCRVHGPLQVGQDVMIGPDVLIYATNHESSDVNAPMIGQGFQDCRRVFIEDDVWIGARAIILPGVTIGTGSIIGAGAVVTTDVPPYSVAAGNPAVVIRHRV